MYIKKSIIEREKIASQGIFPKQPWKWNRIGIVQLEGIFNISYPTAWDYLFIYFRDIIKCAKHY